LGRPRQVAGSADENLDPTQYEYRRTGGAPTSEFGKVRLTAFAVAGSTLAVILNTLVPPEVSATAVAVSQMFPA